VVCQDLVCDGLQRYIFYDVLWIISPFSSVMTPYMSPRLIVIDFLLILLGTTILFSDAFTATTEIRRKSMNGSLLGFFSDKSQLQLHLGLQNDLFADLSVTIRTDVARNNIPTIVDNKVIDKNGREFIVGCIVRVCVDELKAYQVNAKAQGSYNDQKIFVPDTSAAKKKSLLLPLGLRGCVVKVYDENVISANLPIVVQFTPGENTEEGYDPPTAFRMHFTPQELECVSF
jgi:hypothetical protein